VSETTFAISAFDIADALNRPRPTDQQRAVIEAGLAPALIVAGAGSGKTETMANRVLWLLANGLVRPTEVLGLTFTRKAAGELAARIRERIAQLNGVGLLPGDYDPFEAPNVSTYNSYANSLFRDNAVVLGRESDGSVLGEAAAWQLARRVVTRSSDPRLPDLGKNLEPVTRAVLGLSRAMAENDVDAEKLRTFAKEFRTIENLPNGGRGEYHDAVLLAETVGSLDVLIDLAAEVQSVKATRGLIEYADQVSMRGSATAWFSSTSIRTPPSCRPGCSPNCSPGIRSWRSAIPTSRSTAGAGRAPRTSTTSRAPSPVPDHRRRRSVSPCRPVGATGIASSRLRTRWCHRSWRLPA
jgi:DNA helicase-2/ATP-dependent DNA helicase PcrA